MSFISFFIIRIKTIDQNWYSFSKEENAGPRTNSDEPPIPFLSPISVTVGPACLILLAKKMK